MLLTALVSLLAACGTASPEVASPGNDRAPVAASITRDGVKLDFLGGQGACMILEVTGTAEDAGWWAEPPDCPGIDYVEVQYLAPQDGTAILFAPGYEGRLTVTDLPPSRASARVVVSGAAGTGWFEGMPE